MPTKFRKNVWIKRGDYIVVKPIAEGDKVKAEIVQILYKDQIKYIQENGIWPNEFGGDQTKKDENQQIPDDMLPPSDSEDESEEIVKNINYPNRLHNSNESSSESDEQN